MMIFRKLLLMITGLITGLVIVLNVASAETDSPSLTTYYVATTGNDANPGTLAQPWATVQHAATTAVAGDTVLVRGGSYGERVTIANSGTAGNIITFKNYPDETPILDGTSVTVPGSDNGLFLIDSKNYIRIEGFELRNYTTSNEDRVPVGIFVVGSAHHIDLIDNLLHHIETNAGSDGNAHGIAVYGSDPSNSIHDIMIDGNELRDMKLGNSEAMVLNGNVEQFTVQNNSVHDNDNIGIDLIGFEGTASDPLVDQARDGVVRDNVVYNIDTITNPAYGGERSAAGIYVDGGTRILIERNRTYANNFGIEIASEHAGRSTSYVTVQNNLIYNNQIAGLAMGGYDTDRGSTDFCKIINNTFFHNDSLQDGNGEFYIQYDTNNNVIENNIVYANSQNVFMTNAYTENTNNTVDYNSYYSVDGAANGEWQWKTTSYTGFAAYKSGTGNDSHSVYGNPVFASEGTPDLHLMLGSPAIDVADSAEAPADDFDGSPRPVGVGDDIGAYEYGAPTAIAQRTETVTESQDTPTPAAWILALALGMFTAVFIWLETKRIYVKGVVTNPKDLEAKHKKPHDTQRLSQ